MMFGLPPVRLVADFRASAMGIKPKSPGSVATVSEKPGISGSGGWSTNSFGEGAKPPQKPQGGHRPPR